MSFSTQRAILTTLKSEGPMPAKALAAVLGNDPRTVANICSSMSGAGLLTEHPNDRGGRHGRKYGAAVDVHPADERTLAEFIRVYGLKLVRKALTRSRPADGDPT